MPKIVVLDGYASNPGDLSWNSLARLGELTVYERTAPQEVASHIGDADIVFTNKAPITQTVLAACPSIRFIGVLATGYNIVDTAACKRRGIPVCNVPAYSTASVAQMAIALLLEICLGVGGHAQSVREGQWCQSPDFCYWNTPLIELSGKTMGLIGYGQTGQATAAIARALGMNILCYTRHGGYPESVTLDELFAKSDVISLHCPLTEENRGLICKKTIGQMKDGVILLNTARGPLVVEEDLAKALDSGKVYAAGMDVVSVEPIAPDNPLLRAKNCFITPHIAWAPLQSRQRLMDIAVDNLRQFLAGSPVNVVNP